MNPVWIGSYQGIASAMPQSSNEYNRLQPVQLYDPAAKAGSSIPYVWHA
jgi:hypothetical protein